ncbi:hypothetical protein AK830_g1800 [Neonectria ditissima]|uniref:60S ribosomal protein L22 n=1 Tax=Neonectria ditissima TaxID=78410 RepID=A0A0P7BHF9_9HYPO|nr:hypothetical protein AK830_g1800 [Neonectria ditissima]
MAPQTQKKAGKAQKQTKKVRYDAPTLTSDEAHRGFEEDSAWELGTEIGPGNANARVPQFIINASQPASDKIFDVAAFEKFLQDRIKVEGRTNNLGDAVTITQQGEGKIEIIAHNDLSGRYLKYLTKKFLKKQQLRDWLRVVSTSRGVYELKFFNVVNDEAEEDDE